MTESITYTTPSIDVINDELIILRNVPIAYPIMGAPNTNTNDKGETRSNWTVTAFIDEDTADEWEMLKLNNPEVKKFLDGAEAFEERFKFAPPFAGKKQYMLRFNTSATFYNRKEDKVQDVTHGMRIRPSFETMKDGDRVSLLDVKEDGSCDINTLVANGSVADIAIQKQHVAKYGSTNGKLRGVMVTNLIEAERTVSAASDPFAAYGSAPAQATVAPAPTQAPAPQQEQKPDEEDLEDSIPF